MTILIFEHFVVYQHNVVLLSN